MNKIIIVIIIYLFSCSKIATWDNNIESSVDFTEIEVSVSLTDFYKNEKPVLGKRSEYQIIEQFNNYNSNFDVYTDKTYTEILQNLLDKNILCYYTFSPIDKSIIIIDFKKQQEKLLNPNDKIKVKHIIFKENFKKLEIFTKSTYSYNYSNDILYGMQELGNPIFSGDENSLYASSEYCGSLGLSGKFSLGYDYKITSQTDTKINFDLYYTIPSYEEPRYEILTKSSTAVLTPDGWRLTEMLY